MLIKKIPAGVTPKEGCYILLKIYKNPALWKPEIEEFIADAYYKKAIDSQFNPVLEQIRLKPLFNKFSTHWSSLDYEDCAEKLLNTVVQITKVEKVEVEGLNYTTYSMEWSPVEKFEQEEMHKLFPSYYHITVPINPIISNYGAPINLNQITGSIDDDEYE